MIRRAFFRAAGRWAAVLSTAAVAGPRKPPGMTLAELRGLRRAVGADLWVSRTSTMTLLPAQSFVPTDDNPVLVQFFGPRGLETRTVVAYDPATGVATSMG